MQLIQALALSAAMVQTVSAHYVFSYLITDSTKSEDPVRIPPSYLPISTFTDTMFRCNNMSAPAASTAIVSAGKKIGFAINPARSLNGSAEIYHDGPADMFIAKAPASTDLASWDGDGEWFKIAEWGANFNPFTFTSRNRSELTTVLPNLPIGEYLIRIDHIVASAVRGPNTFNSFMSCAQIKIINGSGELPTGRGVKIPGYLTGNEDGLFVDTANATGIKSYKVPGPEVFLGTSPTENGATGVTALIVRALGAAVVVALYTGLM